MKNKMNLLGVAIICTTMLFTIGAKSARAEQTSESLNKEAIEAIIHDYIMDNPMVILNAVEQHQRRSEDEKRVEGMKKNAKLLFEDPETPIAGNPNGDVTVIEFFDYNCGYCKRVWPALAKLLDNDDNVKVLFKEHPILGPSSMLASRWALASKNQGKYFEFHKALIESRGSIDESKLTKIAKKLDLDVKRLKKDAESRDITGSIQKTHALALELGLTGTPAFIVGDKVVPGAVTYEQLKLLVSEQRKNK